MRLFTDIESCLTRSKKIPKIKGIEISASCEGIKNKKRVFINYHEGQIDGGTYRAVEILEDPGVTQVLCFIPDSPCVGQDAFEAIKLAGRWNGIDAMKLCALIEEGNPWQ